MLWKRNDMPASNNIFQGDEDEENKENWSVYKVLRSVTRKQGLSALSSYHTVNPRV